MSGELAMKPDGGLSSCFGGFFDGIEASEIVVFPVLRDDCSEASGLFTEGHAFSAGCIVRSTSRVHGVCHAVSGPQVSDPVIAPVSVDVVDFIWEWSAVGQQPCDAVCVEVVFHDVDFDVAALDGSGGFIGELCVPDFVLPWVSGREVFPASWFPEEDAGFWVVVEQLAQMPDIRHILCSHLILLALVGSDGQAGGTVGAVPSSVWTIAHEFR